MIFRRNKEWGYTFVHESFREYFMATHLSSIIKKWIVDFDVFFWWLLNISFNSMDMLMFLLSEKEKKYLVDVIIENQNFLPRDIKGNIIYILGKIDRWNMLSYLKNVLLNGEIIKSISTLGWEIKKIFLNELLIIGIFLLNMF